MLKVIPYRINIISPESWSSFLQHNRVGNSTQSLPSTKLRLQVHFNNECLTSGLELLINSAGFESLRFLSGNACTHEFTFNVDSIGQLVHSELLRYTIVDSNFDEIIKQINGLFVWCRKNTTVVIKSLDLNESEEMIIDAIDNAVFSLEPNKDKNKGYSEFNSSRFIFSFLQTIKELFIDAQKNGNFLLCEIGYDLPL